MKLDIQNIVNGITAVRQRIGAGLIDWSPDSSWNPFDSNGFRERLDKYGEIDDVDFKDIGINKEDETFEFAGRKVLVYIRDRKQAIYDKYGSPKFHIANCDTLKKAITDGNFNKYVVSTKTDGTFKIRILPNGNERLEKLNVCKNCLDWLNYKKYAELNNKQQKNNICNEFSIADFFEQYKITDISQPKHSDDTAPTNDYPKNWDAISHQKKWVKRFTCERCGINLETTPKFLHVHHVNRKKYDNRPENLTVLCVDCHSKQGVDHAQIKNTPEYREFIKIYKR